ncbi:MAG TPA: IS110 family transposase [Oceanospirillales bacterium]|nr:IS110 family transposase [Oceanospirillales bacterium]
MTHSQAKLNKEFIGIDIASKKYDVCYPDESTKVFQNTPQGHANLIKSLAKNIEIIIAMEPSGGYEKELIYALQEAGIDVALCSSFKVKNYAKALGFTAKNDSIDSYVIRHFAKDMFAKGRLIVAPVKSKDSIKLESWLNRRVQVIKMLTSEKQRLDKSFDNQVSNSLKKSIKYHEKEIEMIDKKIKRLSQSKEQIQRTNRYKQVIGIGDVCANGLSIYLPELGHYPNKVIAAIVGVAPYCRESGKYKGKSKISGGRDKLRSILYMGILSAIKYNKVIGEFYYRLKKKGKPHNVAMIACMRKMLFILNAMERNKTDWDVNYCSD